MPRLILGSWKAFCFVFLQSPFLRVFCVVFLQNTLLTDTCSLPLGFYTKPALTNLAKMTPFFLTLLLSIPLCCFIFLPNTCHHVMYYIFESFHLSSQTWILFVYCCKFHSDEFHEKTSSKYMPVKSNIQWCIHNIVKVIIIEKGDSSIKIKISVFTAVGENLVLCVKESIALFTSKCLFQQPVGLGLSLQILDLFLSAALPSF